VLRRERALPWLAALGEEQLSADDSGSRVLRFETDSMTAWSGVVAQFV
jgi:hypothetical protein